MRGFSPKRWMLVVTMVLWAAAAMLQNLAPLVPSPLQASTSGLSETAAAEIHIDGEVPGRQGTCHHHPQGCPSDCFCPKTGFVRGEPAESTDPSHSEESPSTVAAGEAPDGAGGAHLGETVWVECSEVRALARPVLAVYLPVLAPVISVMNATEEYLPAAPALPRPAATPPPAKIPIA